MAKIEHIKKARKEWKCGRCSSTIAVGQPYYKAEINFGPTIVRCNRCGLAHWEATTSDFTLAVGEIANRWNENFTLEEGVQDEIASALQEVLDEQQERRDNMPESLQESGTGEIIGERIDNLESVISDLECMDIDSIKSEAVEEVMMCEEDDSEDQEDEEEKDFDTLMESSETSEELKDKLQTEFESKLRDAIDDILSALEY